MISIKIVLLQLSVWTFECLGTAPLFRAPLYRGIPSPAVIRNLGRVPPKTCQSKVEVCILLVSCL